MEKINKHPLNVQGKFYVDFDTCIDHECCVEAAPDNFKMDEENWSAYVYKQPSTLSEENACIDAMKVCPVEAVRNDG